MSGLINDMLDESPLISGNVVLLKKAVNLNAILLDSIAQVRPLIDANGLAFSFAPTLSRGVISGDSERLRQIFMTLLQNAATSTPRNGRVSLSAHDHGDEIAVTVKDDGVGIEPEFLHRVFHVFVQGTERFDSPRCGSGFSLALVKSLVELHGGTIFAASGGTNKGAEFTVRFPKVLSEPTAASVARSSAETNAGANGCHILLVDDNKDASELLAFLLEEDGYLVTTAADPFHALEIAQAAPPDFFILDIGLPGMDGNELARRLRGMPANAHTPMVALTGYGHPYDYATAKLSGFDHFFVKPTGIDQLLKVMSEIRANAKCH